MDPVAALEPRLVWSYFSALSAIPRPSKEEAAAAEWVAECGRKLGPTVERDAVGNVLIRKPAAPGCEGAPTVAMQAHVDMVCEKNEEVAHDFSKDPIRLRIDGDLVRATGTTLGADDGIGVAAGLAILADPSLRHGPLELLVTIDEETGLTGANELAAGWLRARYLLNLDMEEEGTITIGCAGGVDTIATRTPTWEPPSGLVGLRVKLYGCKGGHSGGDIHLGRANAIRVLAQVLDEAGGPRLAAFNGGNKRNAIPREAWAIVGVPAAEVDTFAARVRAAGVDWQAAFAEFDPGLAVSVEPAELPRVMSAADSGALLGLLLAAPHGVEAMSPAIPGLVQTSTNLGVVRTSDTEVQVNLLTRSSIEPSKFALARRIAAIVRLAGFDTEEEGGYPGWKPVPGTRLVQLIDDAWKARSGKAMSIIAVHAGLECGLIGEKYPGMEMASFGPDVRDAHTPDENVNVPSVARFWGLLRDVVERLAVA